MRSGEQPKNQFERFTNLLANVTQLMTTGKRNPEAVNNVLQEIVFGKQKKLPKGKFWPSLVASWKASSNDPARRSLILAIAMLDMKDIEKREPYTIAYVEGFPYFFHDEEV